MSKKSTKNAKGGGTIRKRSDGRWEGRYSIGLDPQTGKQIQKSVYGATQKEVRQKLTKIDPETLAQASRIPGVSPSDINVLLVLMGR